MDDFKVKSYDPNGNREDKRKFITKKRLRIFLFALGGALLLAAAAVFIVQWLEGEAAAKNAQVLLDESGITPETAASDQATVMPPSETEGGYEQPDAPDAGSEEEINKILETELDGYSVIARLDIEALDIHLPVLSETSSKALKVSVCYYSGPGPGEGGNLVITGHNYRNGAHFGTLDSIEEGVKVNLTGVGGKTYNYTVYKLEHIKPDEAEKLDNTQYTRELTLLTCEARGNRRLVVRCSADG